MLALGVMNPRAAQAHHRIRRRRYFGSGGRRRGIGFSWALMQFLFQPVLGALSDRFGRAPIVLASNFGLGLDYIFMALAAIAAVSVYRPADLRRHRRELLHRQRLCRRHHARGKARRALRDASARPSALASFWTGYRWRTRRLRAALPFYAAAALSLLNALYGYFILRSRFPRKPRAKIAARREYFTAR